MEIYIARRGDTLSSVARRFAVPPGALASTNQLGDPTRLTPGLALLIPPPPALPQRSMELAVCAGPGVCGAGMRALLPLGTYFCGFTSGITEAGALYAQPDAGLFSAASAEQALPLLTVSNIDTERGGFSSARAHALLGDAAAQDEFFDRLCRHMTENRCTGVLMYLQYIYPFERDAYSHFLRRAADTLHPLGCYLLAAAAPKLPGRGDSAVSAGQDYAALGEYCDRVLLCSAGPLQPHSPEGAVAYAVSQIPAGKLLLDVSAAGSDRLLPPGPPGESSIPCAAAQDLAIALGAEIRHDSAANVSCFDYTDPLQRRHRVSLEDIRCARARLRLAEDYALGGLSLWCGNALYRPLAELIAGEYSIEKLL